MVGMLRKKHCRTCFICQCLLLKELSLSWTTLAANPIFARAPPRHGSPLHYQDESWNLAVKKKLSDDGAGARTTVDKAWFSIIFIYVLIGVWWFWCANRKSSTFLSPIAAETWSHSTCSAWSVLIVVIRSKGSKESWWGQVTKSVNHGMSMQPETCPLGTLSLEARMDRPTCWPLLAWMFDTYFISFHCHWSNVKLSKVSLYFADSLKDAAWKVLEQGSGYAHVERLLWKIAMKISQAARFGEFGKFKGKTIGASRWHSLANRPDPSSFSVPVMPVQRQVVPVVPVIPAQRQLIDAKPKDKITWWIHEAMQPLYQHYVCWWMEPNRSDWYTYIYIYWYDMILHDTVWYDSIIAK